MMQDNNNPIMTNNNNNNNNLSEASRAAQMIFNSVENNPAITVSLNSFYPITSAIITELEIQGFAEHLSISQTANGNYEITSASQLLGEDYSSLNS